MEETLMQPVEIIRSFVTEHLDGNLDALATYHLWDLRDKVPYNECTCGRFDPDDSLLMRAIYCVVFGDVWGGLTLEDSHINCMRGETMNSFRTLFGNPWEDKVSEKWHYDTELTSLRWEFAKTYHTIGNMMVLPDKRLETWSINTHRGCAHDIQDYMDRSLKELYKILTDKSDADADLAEIVELNNDRLNHFYGEEGWKDFVKGNMLEYYCDENFIPVVKSKGYSCWSGGYINHDRYINECKRYINDSTYIIKDRARRMIEKIYKFDGVSQKHIR